MIQDFADWLVYGLFGLSADTPLGVGLTTLMNGKVRAVARSLEKVEVNSGFLRRKKRLKMLQRSKLPL